MELPKCADWVKSKEASINGILVALGSVGSYVLRNPEGNLGQFHKTISDLREKQEFIRTMVFKTISMESECKKMVALVTEDYKDAMAKAFKEHAGVVEKARSMEEKELKLREYLPIIRELKTWEATFDNIKSLREAAEFIYRDISFGSMALNLQLNVVRSQVLNGEVKILFGEGAIKSLLHDNSLDSLQKAALKNTPNGVSDLGGDQDLLDKL